MHIKYFFFHSPSSRLAGQNFTITQILIYAPWPCTMTPWKPWKKNILELRRLWESVTFLTLAVGSRLYPNGLVTIVTMIQSVAVIQYLGWWGLGKPQYKKKHKSSDNVTRGGPPQPHPSNPTPESVSPSELLKLPWQSPLLANTRKYWKLTESIQENIG